MIKDTIDLKTTHRDNDIARERELIILEACRGLAEELLLVDPADYVSLLYATNLIALTDLVTSSIEPFFRAEAVSFACSGEYRLSWSEPPSICLDFELLHDGVFAFFRIVLGHQGPDVELNHIAFDCAHNPPAANTESLRQAMASASLP